MKAVIPAAGLGTRLLPATKAQPKEMLPVYDKPTIHYVVEEALKAGIDDIMIVTGRNKRSIEDYFDKSHELEYMLQKAGKDRDLKKVRKITDLADICYVRQKDLKGLGDAVLAAERHVGDEPFAVLLGDSIVKCNSCTGHLVEYERLSLRCQHNCIANIRKKELPVLWEPRCCNTCRHRLLPGGQLQGTGR